MKRKIWALTLVLTMVLSTASLAIAAPLDLVHRVDNAKNYGFTEFVDSPDVFDKVISDSENYLIEADNGNLYSILEVNEKTEQGKSFEEAIKELEPVELDKDLEVVEVSAINAKGLKVVFNRPITKEEAAKDLEVEIKRGNVPVNQADVEFTEDLKALEIELVTKLRKGEYTVAVKGLTDEALTGSVEVEDEKVAKIELGDKAVLQKEKQEEDYVTNYTTAKVSCKVFNQYGEDITERESSGDYHVTPVGAGIAEFNTKEEAITLEPIADEFKLGDKIRVTVVNTKTGVSTSKEIEVSEPAAVAEINFGKIYNEDDKELNNETINSDEFYLLFEAKDQYGNKIENDDELTADLILVSTNPYIVKAESIEKITIDGKDNLALKLDVEGEPNFHGTATIKLISKTTGNTFKHDVTVNEAPRVDKVVLSAPEELVVEDEKVEIPFMALDQFGNEITKYNELSGKIKLDATEGTVELGKDPVTKEAVITFKAEGIVEGDKIDAKKPVTITVHVTEEGHFSFDRITIDVMKKAQPVTVGGLKDVEKSVTPKSTLEIKAENVVVYDQYGREMELDNDFFEKNTIKVDYNDEKTDHAVEIVEDSDSIKTEGTIKLKGVKKGSEKFKLFLANKDKQVEGTEAYVFTVECVEKGDVAEYEVKDINPLLVKEDGKLVSDENYKNEIVVYGKKADGSKVAISKDLYTVTVDHDKISYDKANGEFELNEFTFDEDEKDFTITVTIIVNAEDEPVVLTKDVLVKKYEGKVATIEYDDDKDIENDTVVLEGKTADGEVSYDNIIGYFVFKDENGVKVEEPNAAITITNCKDKDGNEIDGAEEVTKKTPFKLKQGGEAEAEAVHEFKATVVAGKATKKLTFMVEYEEPVEPEEPEEPVDPEKPVDKLKEEAKKYADFDVEDKKVTATLKAEAGENKLANLVTKDNLSLAKDAGISAVKIDEETIEVNENTTVEDISEKIGEKTLNDLVDENITITIGKDTYELTIKTQSKKPEE